MQCIEMVECERREKPLSTFSLAFHKSVFYTRATGDRPNDPPTIIYSLCQDGRSRSFFFPAGFSMEISLSGWEYFFARVAHFQSRFRFLKKIILQLSPLLSSIRTHAQKGFYRRNFGPPKKPLLSSCEASLKSTLKSRCNEWPQLQALVLYFNKQLM